MATISPQPKLQFFTANGEPLSGGKLYTYAAGTTTPLATYTDEGGLTPNANPVILNSRGEASVWLDNANYKFKLTSSTDVEIWTVDDIDGSAPASLAALAASTGSSLIGYLPAGGSAVATTVQAKLRQFVTPFDFGAVGDGVTDDRAALKAALESGYPVDGCGYNYGIDGSCSPSSIVGFQNATLVQIGDRSASNASTLYLFGLSDFFIKDLNINMGTGVTTLFSDDGNNGLHILGTNTSTFSENFSVENVSVTGNGCGTGIHIRNAKLFTVDNCVVYDRVSGSSPDPTNDSQNGMQLHNCADFTLSNSQTKNLQTRLSGAPTLKWTRGFLFVECRNCSIIGCNTNEVDQGFDFSGAYDAGTGFIGNREWTVSGCTASNCTTIGFKFANVARDGLITGCIASNIGNFGFGFSGSVVALPAGAEKYNTQNIDVVGCKVVNMTGAGWATSNAEAFRLAEAAASTSYPRAIRFKSCHVADTQTVPTTAKAFVSDVAVVEDPDPAALTNIANTMSDCTADSTVTEFIASPDNIGPNICQVTGNSTQSISNSAWTEIDWNVDLIDPCGFHSTTSNNNMIIVKTPGWYRLTVLANFAASATGSRQVRFIKQGTTVDRSTAIAPGSSGTKAVMFSSVMTYVESGQNLRVEVFQDSGGPLAFNTNESHFAVELVSA
jgi:hypothetical protein